MLAMEGAECRPRWLGSSFEVGHQQFFWRLFVMWPRVPALKIEAAEDRAGNHDGRGQENCGIEHWAEHRPRSLSFEPFAARSSNPNSRQR